MDIKDKKLHRVALTAIVYNDEGKYLVTKRSMQEKAFPGRWTVPGGTLETDDYINTEANTDGLWYNALENTLRKEVREETGAEIEKPEYLCDIVFVRPDGVPVVILSYFAKHKSGEITLDNDDDTVDYKWVTYEEAKNVDLIGGILDEIKMVDEILGQRG